MKAAMLSFFSDMLSFLVTASPTAMQKAMGFDDQE
jgi:hypothetical protein